jgi:hypothetical protein
MEHNGLGNEKCGILESDWKLVSKDDTRETWHCWVGAVEDHSCSRCGRGRYERGDVQLSTRSSPVGRHRSWRPHAALTRNDWIARLSQFPLIANAKLAVQSSCLHRASTVSKHFLFFHNDAHNYKITAHPHNRLVCCHDIDHVIIDEDIEPYCRFS